MTTQPSPYNVPTAAANTPSGEIVEARRTCRELMALLVEENHGLGKQDIKLVDERIQHKRRLTLRLEQMLAEMKKAGSLWKADTAARSQANLLAEEIAQFQELAVKNVAMLQAAHQLRADLILAIRDTVDAATPRAQTYGANGAMTMSDNNTRLLATSI
ncbi:MAG: hypothetical protein DI585_05840 [Pseudomonas fluorescens]|nr:MAG: hypothetical protein DI585_05840 [Pseudomonas fluorescens]